VDFVEQGWQSLHLVDDHPTSRRHAPQFLAEEAGVAQVALVHGLVEQVDTEGVREGEARPGALADAAHPEQEEGLSRAREESWVPQRGHHVVNYTGKMTAWLHEAICLGGGPSAGGRPAFIQRRSSVGQDRQLRLCYSPAAAPVPVSPGRR
jgi:hypothetical protein